jgi:protoporphyrinogen oxidase
MSDEKPHVVILGAGPAGVGAAYQLAKQQLAKATVLEQHDTVGGNAGSFEFEGLFLDYGSHRLHPACDPRLLTDLKQLLGDDLLLRPRHGRIRLKNRWIRFPLKPLDLLTKLPPTFPIGVGCDAIAKVLPASNKEATFASILQRQLGRTICRDFYFPYARKIWGLEPDRISAVQAQKRVSANSLTKIAKKVFSSSRRQAPSFYYPKRGFGQIWEAISGAAREHGAGFEHGAKVSEVHHEGGQVRAVTYECDSTQRTLQADYVWSTIPVTVLLRCLNPKPPESVLQAATRIKLRAMILVYLVLEQPQFSEFDAHYFPGIDVPITRLSEPKNYSHSQEPNGVTALCAELPCDLTDDVWTQTDDKLAGIVRDSLARVQIPLTAPVRHTLVRRIPHAYPIYDNGFEEHLRIVDSFIGNIDQLLTFGRQGLFVHDNSHHALYMSYAAVDCMDAEGHFDDGKWKEYRQVFESHVVED